MRLVFWQNTISPHLAPQWRALCEAGYHVAVVALGDLTSRRRLMGWETPETGNAEVFIAPAASTVEALVSRDPERTVHVLGGAWLSKVGREVIRLCHQHRCRFGIMSEAANGRGWKGAARRLRYVLERCTRGRSAGFVLAMGELGVRWFVQCGYRASTVFPYAYTVEPRPPFSPLRPERDARCVALISVGALAPWKGHDVLLRALAQVADTRWRLALIGEGPMADRLARFATSRVISARVAFSPFRPHEEVMRQIAASDLLVLPSRWDGWGAVVNEALMCGVPVVCTDRCGARDLLTQAWRGEVVPAGSAAALGSALTRWIAQGPTAREASERIAAWARCVDGSSMAAYLAAVLEHVYGDRERPQPPWRGAEAADGTRSIRSSEALGRGG